MSNRVITFVERLQTETRSVTESVWSNDNRRDNFELTLDSRVSANNSTAKKKANLNASSQKRDKIYLQMN